MRVAQETHVENQVGIARQPPRESERGDRDGRLTESLTGKSGADLLRELVGGQVGRIDQPVRPVAKRREELAFAGDAVTRRSVERERVAASRLGITPLEFPARAVEEQHADVVTMVAAELPDPLQDPLGVEIAGAGANA